MSTLHDAVRERNWKGLVKIHSDLTQRPPVRAFALAMACYFAWVRIKAYDRADWCGAEADVQWNKLTEEEMP